MDRRVLTALPVFNEETHIDGVLAAVGRFADEILVVDDGSSGQNAAVARTAVSRGFRLRDVFIGHSLFRTESSA